MGTRLIHSGVARVTMTSLKDSLHGRVVTEADIEETDIKLGKGSYGEVVQMVLKGKPVAGKRIHPIFLEQGNAGAGNLVERFKEECMRYVSKYSACLQVQ